MDTLLTDNFLLTIALVNTPLLIAAFVAYIFARRVGVSTYAHGTTFIRAYLFALSTFLIVNFLLVPTLLWGIMLLFGEVVAFYIGIILMISNPYMYWISWGIKICASILLYFSLRRLPAPTTLSNTQPVQARILKTLPLFIVAAIITLLIPLYSLYHSYQVKTATTEKREQVAMQVEDAVNSDAKKVQAALEQYRVNNGLYPDVLEKLVPTYIDKIWQGPRASGYDYATSKMRTNYRLCAYVNTGKKCLMAQTDWAPTRSYCISNEEQLTRDCQWRNTPETTPVPDGPRTAETPPVPYSPSKDSSASTITANIREGKAPLTVQFSVEYMGLGTYWVEFGDGQKVNVTCTAYKPETDACIAYNREISHTYTQPGKYQAIYVEESHDASGTLKIGIGFVGITVQ